MAIHRYVELVGRVLRPEAFRIVDEVRRRHAGAAATGVVSRAGLWILVGYAVLLLSAALILGINIRAHRVEAEHAAELLAQAEALRDEQAQVATLQERTRIAREIHDVLAHSLGALGLQIELIRAVLTDSDDTPHAVELLDQAHRMTTTGLTERIWNW